MSESLDAFAELRNIRARLEGIEHKQEMLVRAQAPDILRLVLGYLDSDDDAARIYLLIDGKRTQNDILAALNAAGFPISQSTVSRRLSELINDLGLVEMVERGAEGIVYRKSQLDRILHLAPKVRKNLDRRTPGARKPFGRTP